MTLQAPATPRSRYLALPTGLTYHLLEWLHPTSETTIVLVHGFLDNAWGWRWVADELAAEFHVVAPDLRGHGDSDWVGPGGYYYFFDYLADLDALLPRIARRRLVLVGHSMGGSVVSYWAGARAGDASRLQPAALALLEGLGPAEQPDAPAAQAKRVAAWIDQWRRARVDAPKVMPSLEDAAARIARHDPLLSAPRARELAERGTRAALGGFTWKHDPLHLTFGPLPFRRALAASLWEQIAAPTLLVDADASTLRLPEPEAALRRGSFRDGRHAIIAGAGHMMQRHQPAALAKLLSSLAAA